MPVQIGAHVCQELISIAMPVKAGIQVLANLQAGCQLALAWQPLGIVCGG